MPVDRLIARGASVCAVGAGALALTGLAAWPLGTWPLLAFGREYVPMAPSTALLMGLLSIAASLRARPSLKRTSRILEDACVLVVLGAGLLFGVARLWGFALPLESWGSAVPETASGIPVGRMSPLAAGWFVMAAASLLCGRANSGRWQALRSLGGWLSAGVLMGSGIVVAGYLAGTPFLYGLPTIPMALLTAGAFVLVSAATLLGAGSDVWPLRMFLRRSTEDNGGAPHRVEWSFLSLFLVLAAGITAAAFGYISRQEADARSGAWAGLKAVADLKVQQIVNWRKERLADANLIRATPYTARRALDALAKPESATTRRMFTSWLQPLLVVGLYERAILLDAQMNVRLAHPDTGSRALAETVRNAANEALRTRQVTVADLHRSTDNGHALLDFLVPLVVRREGTNDNVPAAGLDASAADRSAGVLILQVNAHEFLFPLVQSWPAASRTAETMLVRREGREILYLNEPRHRKGMAMTLRRPLEDPWLPAAMGLRGERGVHEGLDYRGVRVVAAVLAVPDTPWLMVAKVDSAEVYAPLLHEALTVIAAGLALLLAATLGVTVLWRRRNEHLLQEQLAVERDRRALAERFEHLMKNANDAILLADHQYRIIEANAHALALYGYSLPQLQGMKLPELRPLETRADFDRQAELLATTGRASFETLHRRKDGTVFPVDVSGRVIEIAGTRYKLGIIRDITQRKAHEREIERLNRLYATLSQVNQAIVHAQSREELLQSVCRATVEFGGFKFAWIGWLQPDSATVACVACHADGADAALWLPGQAPGCGIVAEALRSGSPCFSNNTPQDPRTAVCHGAAARFGISCCAAVPFRFQDRVQGTLAICTQDRDFFNPEELRLLEEVAMDISYALDRLQTEERRRQAEKALQESEALYRSLVENLPQHILRKDSAGRFTFANDRFCRNLGKTLEEIVGKSDADLFAPDFAAKYQQDDRQVMHTGQTLELVEEYQTPGGERRYVHVMKTPLRGFEGQPVGVQCIFWDITDRKKDEDRLRKLARVVDQSPVSILITDRDGNIEFVNPMFTKATGYTPAEVLGKNPRILKSGETPLEEYECLWKTIRAGKQWKGEFHNRRKDGTLFWETAVISPLFDDAGEITHYIAVKEDTTGKKQLEAQFLRVQRMESIGALAGGIAHDLNNILTPILMSAPLLKQTITDPEGHAMIDIVESCAQRGAAIIRQLLTFARGAPGARVPLPVQHLLRDMDKIVRETFPRHIQPRVTASRDLWLAPGDATQLHQALMNLCVNARDAMPDGGTLTLGVKNVTVDYAFAAMVPGAQPGPYVCISVADTGTGITPENLDRIFDPFFTTKEVGKGTGLGLATVLGIVRGHDGFVRVDSQLGQGTTFELYFPASPGAQSPPATDRSTRPSRGQAELILVVDDEPSVRNSLRRTLEAHGYRVVTAAHGAEALPVFSQHRADVRAVLTDMMMPVMDGPALINALRILEPRLPILGMSGLPEQKGLEGFDLLKLPTLLTKPFSGDDLLRVLGATLQASAPPPSPPKETL